MQWKVARFVNATTQLQQLSVTTDWLILWYTTTRVIADLQINCDIDLIHEAALAS